MPESTDEGFNTQYNAMETALVFQPTFPFRHRLLLVPLTIKRGGTDICVTNHAPGDYAGFPLRKEGAMQEASLKPIYGGKTRLAIEKGFGTLHSRMRTHDKLQPFATRAFGFTSVFLPQPNHCARSRPFLTKMGAHEQVLLAFVVVDVRGPVGLEPDRLP